MGLFLALGTLFGVLAAVAAYVIAYQEYRQRKLKHHEHAPDTLRLHAGSYFPFKNLHRTERSEVKRGVTSGNQSHQNNHGSNHRNKLSAGQCTHTKRFS